MRIQFLSPLPPLPQKRPKAEAAKSPANIRGKVIKRTIAIQGKEFTVTEYPYDAAVELEGRNQFQRKRFEIADIRMRNGGKTE